ncbi:MAG: hypothetical protein ACR2NL_05000 [Acidimicrobiia bacterium]
MRHNILLRSIQRFLEPGERLYDAAFMWSRHRLAYVYALAAFVGMLIVAIVAGFEQWPSRLAIAVMGGAVAMTATTMYRVLASTSKGLVLLEGGKLRQVAKRRIRTLDSDVVVEIQRDTLITTDWKVGDSEYTVPKGSQKAMERIAVITAQTDR